MIPGIKKTTIIPIFLIVICGIVLGMALNLLLPDNILGKSTFLAESTSKASQNDLIANLEVSSHEIEATDPKIDFKKEVEKIKKAVLTITYTNSGNEDLSDVRVLVDVTGGEEYGFLTSESAKYLKREPYSIDINGEETSFKVADVKKGQIQKADIYFYSKSQGKVKAAAKVITKQGSTAKTQSIDLTIR